MKTKLLGRTGVSVSELCFGTMSFGGDADEATSALDVTIAQDTYTMATFGRTTASVIGNFNVNNTMKCADATLQTNQPILTMRDNATAYEYTIQNASSKVSINYNGLIREETWTSTSIKVPTTVTSTTSPQLTVGYDGSNYATLATSSGGVLKIAPTGGTTITNALQINATGDGTHNGLYADASSNLRLSTFRYRDISGIGSLRSTGTPALTLLTSTSTYGYEFPDASDLYLYGFVPIPLDIADATTIYPYVEWYHSTGTGNVVWYVEYMVVGQSGSVAYAGTTSTIVSATSSPPEQLLVQFASSATTSTNAGGCIYVKVGRLGTNVSDTMVASCWMTNFGFRCTADYVVGRSTAF